MSTAIKTFIWLTIIQSMSVRSLEAEGGCGEKPADIVFVLDSSSSIELEDYGKQIQFVNDVVDIFDIGPDKMRVGVITFSDDVQSQFDLGSYTDKAPLESAVNNTRYYGGGTHTDKALKYLRKVSLSADSTRPGVSRIGIILTDGLSMDTERTKEEAYLARDDGIILFVIGIGSGVDKKELMAIGSDPKENFVQKIDNFQALASIKNNLAMKACKAEEQLKPVVEEACGGKPADVVFALDTSSSITPEDYDKQLKFVKDVVRMFDVGQEKTRVGLLTFSDDAYPQFSLEAFSNKQELQEAIMKVTHTGGSTFTGDALKFMRETAFRPSLDRPEAVRIGIILTDGMSHDTQKTLKQAEITRRFANLFVIGIGSEADEEELDGIASTPIQDYRFKASDFDALQSIKRKLAIKACAVEMKPDVMSEETPKGDCLQLGPTDVVFGLDTARFGDSGSSHILGFISNIVSAFQVEPDKVRLSLLTTGCSKRGDIALFQYQNKAGFQYDLLNYEQSDYNTLLRKMRMIGFSVRNGGRPTSAKTALLFLADKPDDIRGFRRELSRAKFKKINVIVVGVGANLDKEVLKDIFGDNFSEVYIESGGLDKLEEIRNDVIGMICPNDFVLGSYIVS